jgi:hypothetical protein
VIESSASWILGESDGRSRIGLGIAIYQKSWLISGSEARGQIHGRSRFANPTFLVRDGDDSGQK